MAVITEKGPAACMSYRLMFPQFLVNTKLWQDQTIAGRRCIP